MKVFITGIAGFVGSNVANSLNRMGIEVYGVDNLAFGSEKNLDHGVRWRKDCISNVTKGELEYFDVLLHMACNNIVFAINDPITTVKTNSEKSIGLFEKWGTIKPIVYTGTSSVYGNSEIIPTPETAPIVLTNAYDTSKFITERYLKLRGNYTTLRLSNVYGYNQRQYGDIKGVIYGVLHSALTGSNIEVNGDGEQTRDYTFIDDVVNAIVTVLSLHPLNTEINIGTGIETSVNDVVDKAQYINMLYNDINSDVVYIPRRGNDGINRRCLDVSKAEKLLGWKPTMSLLTGMMLTAEWMIKEKLVKL